MILRRMVEHLRQQHWTGVLIELAIVVFGVFIGIQVSNWNEARKERSTEAVYLANIARDVRGDSAEMDEIIRISALRMAVLNRLLWQDPARPMPAGFASARGFIAVEAVPAYADNDPNSPGIALFILNTLDGNRSAYDTFNYQCFWRSFTQPFNFACSDLCDSRPPALTINKIIFKI